MDEQPSTVPRRILFVLRHEGLLKNFESSIEELLRRGHQVTLTFPFPSPNWIADGSGAAELRTRFPGLRIAEAPAVPSDARAQRVRKIRLAADYLRYLEPEYEHAPKLRARGGRRVPPAFRAVARRLARHPRALARIARTLESMEASTPPPTAIEAFLADEKPDVMLVSPLLGLGSEEADVVWAAAEKKIPTVLMVASWDNLTNKGRMRAPLDRVVVWNEAQRREAVSMHGLAPDKVAVTGAHSYDHWFEWRPRDSREQFAERVGLAPDREFLLYVCSSKFIAPEERSFVDAWARAIHASTGRLSEFDILVRPHPQNVREWSEPSGAGYTVYPAGGEVPSSRDAKSLLYDSIYHARAVVGINTSALIESAIVGRPVLTITDPTFAETQGGTLHFAHLAQGPTPLLSVAETLPEHLAQLERAVAQPDEFFAASRRAFLESFVRPHGLEEPASPFVADDLERFLESGRTADRRPTRRDPLLAPAVGALLSFDGLPRPPRALQRTLAALGRLAHRNG